MWHTPSGERTLTGDEAALIRTLAASVFEMLDLAFECDDDHWRGGVAIFDALPVAQKITLVASVCDAFFCFPASICFAIGPRSLLVFTSILAIGHP